MIRAAAATLLLLFGCAAPSEFERMSRLEQAVRLAVERASPGSRLSLWLAAADGRELLAIDAGRVLPAASTIKALILAEGYAREGEGTFRWTDETTLLASDRAGGSGTLRLERTGSSWTYLQLARRMISESDNTASNMLLRRLGMDRLNARAAALGLADTRFEREFMDLEARRAGKDNRTTARDLGRLMGLIYRREIATPAACDDMIAILERTSRGWIAAGVPKAVETAHKTGILPGLRADAGWVRLPGRPYLLSIFVENALEKTAGGEDPGRRAIEAAAALVCEEMGPTEE